MGRSPRQTIAITTANSGAAATSEDARATPIRSIPTKDMSRARPGATRPATRNGQIFHVNSRLAGPEYSARHQTNAVVTVIDTTAAASGFAC